MIRGLRRRFIRSAMSAFGILLLILILGITLVSYIHLESRGEAFMKSVLDEKRVENQKPNHEFSGELLIRPKDNPIAYYDVRISSAGEIAEISEKGIWEPDMEAVQEYTVQIMASETNTGKIEGYKYRFQKKDDGSMRLILMDTSMQMHMLRDVLRIVLLLSLACLVLLFVILLPISERVVRSYALHIEKQKQFITNAGHEIKTPVAIILSNIDAMDLIQGENKWSRNIRSQTDRLSLLLKRLLFMARIDEDSMVLPMEVLDFKAVLTMELENYKPILDERKLHLYCDLAGKILLKGNREYLQQMIHMLLDNAVQYANEGGEIHISKEQKRSRVQIMFTNTVEKLPDCPPENLFDRFYRGDSARTQSSGGCGIGLSAARSIAEMHRGEIYAEYIGGGRICFAIELPSKV